MVGWVFIVLVLVVIYMIFETMRLRHGIVSIILIIFLLFFLLSLVFVFKDRQIDLNSFGGIKDATKTYFDWLALTWNNFRGLTGNAGKVDWKGNETKAKTK